MSGSSFLLPINLLHACQMLCKDIVGIFKRLCEKHNFLCSLEKVNREQNPNLKMVVPFV